VSRKKKASVANKNSRPDKARGRDKQRSHGDRKPDDQSAAEGSVWSRVKAKKRPDSARHSTSRDTDAGNRRPPRPGRDRARGQRRQPAARGGQTWVGRVSAHPDGFGFVDVQGLEKGIFLPHEEMRNVMHGDTVEVRGVQRRGRESGEVVRVVEQAPSIFVGEFKLQGGSGIVQPRSRKMPQNIVVSSPDSGNARDGDWVQVEIKRGSHPLRGRVVSVLGNEFTPAGLIDLVVAELQLPHEFPALAMAEAALYPDQVPAKDISGRKDLTGLPFVTIDGVDARDFDDAICVLPRGEGFEAWVAIADVAHYVRPKSALDKEALERSNSFYFPDRVIPMLPEKLSNGLCSLNPHLPRLAMAVRMRFDANGKRHAIHPYEAVIHSQARLTYQQASQWLDQRDASAIDNESARIMLDDAARLFRKLHHLREQRGALDLDVPEVRAVLHEGSVTDMSSSDRNTAHHLIEELMLAANTAVAEYFESKQCPLLYRVHPAPERESIETLNEFLAPFGLFVKMPKASDEDAKVRPGDVQRVLEQSEGKPFAHVLHRLVLRSMQQARYTPENDGHFGLAYTHYAHFTSPIRRYADLTVHRRLKALLQGIDPDKVQPAKLLASVGEQTSIQERKQQRGEWDTQAMLAALFHHKDIGKTMTARISGLTKRRLFFELQDTLAEASLDVDTLSGLFELDEKQHRLSAPRGGLSYALGDEIAVIIEATDPVRGLINVSLAPESNKKDPGSDPAP